MRTPGTRPAARDATSARASTARKSVVRATALVAVALALGLGTAGGVRTDEASAAPTTGEVTTQAVTDRFVVAISIDGLRPDVITASRTPALRRMVTEGASTLNARTAYERTVTLPNHTGMLTGRRVFSKAGHHVGVNHDPGTTVHQEAGRYRASLFDIVHDRGGRTALFASKDKFALFNRSWGSSHGARDRVGPDNGRGKIDRYLEARPGRLVTAIVNELEGNPREATFLHIRLPDEEGHHHGWMSPEYLAAVEQSDRLVGRILDAVDGSARLRASVDVIVTSDHGGAGRTHTDRRGALNYTIPFLVWGVDAARGADLYRLNPERQDPGTGRPRYAAAPPIRNLDVADLVTTLLGHRAVPGGVRGTTPLEIS